MMDKAPLNKIWWLWIPLVFIAVQAVLEMTFELRALSIMHSENGPHETAQALIIGAGFFVALLTLLKTETRQNIWVALWVGLAMLCCFYVAGEEVSWGQHLLEWHTPEFWQGINDQGETNLHNTSSWLDQKPRLILLIGVAMGGLVFPVVQRIKPGLLPQKFSIIYPPAILAVIAALAIGVNLSDKLSEMLRGAALFTRGSEVEELYLFYFVLLYLITLRRRIMQD